jgi:WD40 repeat protein
MRVLAVVTLLALLPAPAFAQKKNTRPIPVITLARKDPVLYDRDVEPILLNKCSFCHSGNVTEGKLDMGSYERLIKGGKRGTPVVAGHADRSLLYRLAGKTQRPLMPPRSEEPLTPEELALIKLWIDQGARAPAVARGATRAVVGVPPPSVQPVFGVAVSPDRSAVAASRGNEIHLYDARSGKHVLALIDPDLTGPDHKPLRAAHLSLVESLAYSPDGKYLASGSYQEVVLWDARTGVLLRRLTGFADRVVALDFSPDGKWLATGGGAPTQDGEVKLFDVPGGRLVADLKNTHSDTVFAVSFRPDGKVLATGAADKFVKTFAVPGGQLLKSFEGHTHHVLGVGWKGDGKLLASAGADNVVKVWDYEKGEQVRTIPGHGKQVTRLVFVGKGPQFATCSADQTVRFWNVDNGGNTRTLPGGSDFLYALAVSTDGALVAAGGQEGVVYLYNGNTGQLLRSLVPPGAKK